MPTSGRNPRRHPRQLHPPSRRVAVARDYAPCLQRGGYDIPWNVVSKGARSVSNLARAEARTATVSAATVLFVPDPLEVKIIAEAGYVGKSSLAALIGESDELMRILSSSVITARRGLADS